MSGVDMDTEIGRRSMPKWTKIASREATLLERGYKTAGYLTPITGTTFCIDEVLVSSNDGFTSHYFKTEVLAEQIKQIYKDFDSKAYKKIFETSNQVITDLIELVENSKNDIDADFLKRFQHLYGLARGVVLYTHFDLLKLEERLKSGLKSIVDGPWPIFFGKVIYPVQGLSGFYEIDEGKVAEKEKILASADLSKATRELLNYFEMKGYFHELAERVTTSFAFPKLLGLLKPVAEKYKISFEDIFWYLPSELISLLENGEVIIEEKIESRKNYYVLIYSRDELELLLGEQAVIVEKQELADQPHIEDKIIGSPACSGKARGTVRLIFKQGDLSKISVQDIVVTPMTRPQWIQGLSKVVAIITDEGGIISHAAIISRELNIPCIVGTKNASKVLNDGDLVEVDADKGIVKLI